MKKYDVIIIGAGGAGLMCAIEAGKRGRKVALLDHSDKVGAKILISGGGRCNFTNIGVDIQNYVSQNPHFCKSALTRYTPQDFIQLVKSYNIPFHEKKLGQLFCDNSAQDIVNMLVQECEKAKVEIILGCKVETVRCLVEGSPSPLTGEGRGEGDGQSEKTPLTLPSPARGEGFIQNLFKGRESRNGGLFHVQTSKGDFGGHSLVIATGGLSIPKVGATDFGYRIAKQFGMKIVEPAPALDGFRLKPADLKKFGDLMGVSADTIVTCNKSSFRENILFTHNGLSGPAALQASLYWNKDNKIHIQFVPSMPKDKLAHWFGVYKTNGSRSEMKTLLREWLPHRLADRLCELHLPEKATIDRMSNEKLVQFCALIQDYVLAPESTVGYSKAEVTRGGVDTDEISSKTMEAKKVKGLYFIGEVVDVTGWLGGYNFQWAWASGHAAGQEV